MGEKKNISPTEWKVKHKNENLLKLMLGIIYMYMTMFWFPNLSPFMKGKERLKKEADHCRFVGGSFNKKGNLHTRLLQDK